MVKRVKLIRSRVTENLNAVGTLKSSDYGFFVEWDSPVWVNSTDHRGKETMIKRKITTYDPYRMVPCDD